MTKDSEHEALADEVRYWKRKALAATKRAETYFYRSNEIERPIVAVQQSSVDSPPVWWRVYVNGEYIDGQGTEEAAERIAVRLRAAFALTARKAKP